MLYCSLFKSLWLFVNAGLMPNSCVVNLFIESRATLEGYLQNCFHYKHDSIKSIAITYTCAVFIPRFFMELETVGNVMGNQYFLNFIYPATNMVILLIGV